MEMINVAAHHLREMAVIETTGAWTLRFNAEGVRFWLNEQDDRIQIDRRNDDGKFVHLAEYQG